MSNDIPKNIDAFPKNIKEILANSHYKIDYYQREFRWETKQITELIEDFYERFMDNYKEFHKQKNVKQYSYYFLGPMIINKKINGDFIIDGQQRLTSLTLLLIYLNNLQNNNNSENIVEINQMIYSSEYGEKSYNMVDPEDTNRVACIDSLFKGIIPERNNHDESIQNIIDRYSDLFTLFPEQLKGHALPLFITWLIEKVYFVKITAFSDEDAYSIFETMNDRGLSLSSAEMLKGYLISKVEESNKKNLYNELWKKRIFELKQIHHDDETDFFKAWLRGKYAQTIRVRKVDSANKDFEKIGTAFHKWVRDEEEKTIRLCPTNDSTNEYESFLGLFDKYSSIYANLRKASQKYTRGFEEIYYNAQNNLTLQYMVLLSPIRPEDSQETIDKKLKLVSTYLDIFIIRRAVNYLTLSYSAISYTMFLLTKDIRGISVNDLKEYFIRKVNEMEFTFSGIPDRSRNGMLSFGLNQWSKRYIRHILARITVYLEKEVLGNDKFHEYTDVYRKDPYQIEHIWSDHYEQHRDEFDQILEFNDYRNRIGDLILVPKSFNTRYSDSTYSEKQKYYLQQNLLAQSLHPQAYEKNPLKTFVQNSGLPIKPHEQYKKQDIDKRQELMRLICEKIWSIDRFNQILS